MTAATYGIWRLAAKRKFMITLLHVTGLRRYIPANAGLGPTLYDVENDFLETKNVVKKFPEAAEEMKKILLSAHKGS